MDCDLNLGVGTQKRGRFWDVMHIFASLFKNINKCVYDVHATLYLYEATA